MSSSRGGRYRRESTRPVDYNATIIGENLVASTQDQEFVEETNLHGMHLNTKRDYRNRLNRLIEYWKEKEPGYFDIGVRDLNQEELNDTSKFYHKNKQDLVYTGNSCVFRHTMATINNKQKCCQAPSQETSQAPSKSPSPQDCRRWSFKSRNKNYAGKRSTERTPPPPSPTTKAMRRPTIK